MPESHRTFNLRPHAPLPFSFYRQRNALALARDLLGCVLVVPTSNGERVSGIIVETEAYTGVRDKASHAYGGRRTARTETMYAAGGTAYVYFVYGLHFQFNVVAGAAEVPEAVLIRALEPVEGLEVMRPRRNGLPDRQLTNGPGKLCAALGIDRSFDAQSLRAERVWIELGAETPRPSQIARGPRVGIDYADDYAQKPWRFWLKNNVYVSRN
jgi:DNA-3-methyladenine glycosylase